jgi:hypothetical protein
MVPKKWERVLCKTKHEDHDPATSLVDCRAPRLPRDGHAGGQYGGNAKVDARNRGRQRCAAGLPKLRPHASACRERYREPTACQTRGPTLAGNAEFG